MRVQAMGVSEAVEQIDAIPATFRGRPMRSRLEVRWAIFLESLGCSWFYEMERFEIGGYSYLPDFFLPGLGWLEVKPAGHEPDHALYQQLAQHVSLPVLLACGPPRLGAYTVTLFRADLAPEHGMVFACGRRDCSELWLASLASGVAVCLSGRSSRSNWPTHTAHALKEAYRAAMGYRFEEQS